MFARLNPLFFVAIIFTAGFLNTEAAHQHHDMAQISLRRADYWGIEFLATRTDSQNLRTVSDLTAKKDHWILSETTGLLNAIHSPQHLHCLVYHGGSFEKHTVIEEISFFNLWKYLHVPSDLYIPFLHERKLTKREADTPLFSMFRIEQFHELNLTSIDHIVDHSYDKTTTWSVVGKTYVPILMALKAFFRLKQAHVPNFHEHLSCITFAEVNPLIVDVLTKFKLRFSFYSPKYPLKKTFLQENFSKVADKLSQMDHKAHPSH